MSFPDFAIGTDGTVGFRAALASGGFGLFTGRGGPLRRVADTAGPVATFLPRISVGGSGTIAFQAGLDAGGGGIFTASGGPLTPIFQQVAGPFRTLFLGQDVNHLNTVAFRAFLGPSPGGQGSHDAILVGNGGPVRIVYDNLGSFFSLGSPAINAGGTVAFGAILRSGEAGIFTGTGGPTTTIADSMGALSGFFPDLDINNRGTVAFIGTLHSGDQGIFTGSGGTLTTIAETTGPYASFLSAPAVDGQGTVAFQALLDTGAQGIFTGPDPAIDKILVVGDPLLGSTVRSFGAFSFGFNNNSMNDAGQVVLHAILADGTEVLALGTPISVSDPPSLYLLVIGIISVSVSFRRRMDLFLVRPSISP